MVARRVNGRERKRGRKEATAASCKGEEPQDSESRVQRAWHQVWALPARLQIEKLRCPREVPAETLANPAPSGPPSRWAGVCQGDGALPLLPRVACHPSVHGI
ncbi:hypothetical protein scyTo_0012234 [Scyliorhinus torazame]|uniref:Uncharacterized protein n=1 Tax=Scyliorhinus torazame TaxID=75743 RepID=A0A401P4R9_SCYTO|nr:hypothetical protein [Scyliorhinus torazame]